MTSDTSNGTGSGQAATPGEMLRAKREQQGMSVEDVANYLRLSPRQVQALEENDFDALPGLTFVRGFIRNYARLLHLDPQPLLALAPELTPLVQPKPIANVSERISYREQQPIFGSGKRVKPLPLLIGIAAVVIVAIIAVIVLRHRSAAPQAAQEAAPGTPAATSTATNPAPENAPMLPMPPGAAPAAPPVTQVAPAAPTTGPMLPSTPAPAAAAPGSGAILPPTPSPAGPAAAPARPAAPAAPASPAAPAATPPGAQTPAAASAGRLKVSVSAASWVKVTDAHGKTLLAKLLPAGASQVVEGPPPLKVTVGNAPSAQILYNDKPVNLATHTSGQVARLTLE